GSMLLWVLFNASWTTGYTESLHWVIPFSALAIGWFLSQMPRTIEIRIALPTMAIAMALLSFGISAQEGKIYSANLDNYRYRDIEAAQQTLRETGSPIYAAGDDNNIASHYFFPS